MTFRLDLRGVKCPLNWAKARVVLEEMKRGEELVLIVDDERAVRDIPRAAAACGYAVDDPERGEDAWTIRVCA